MNDRDLAVLLAPIVAFFAVFLPISGGFEPARSPPANDKEADQAVPADGAKENGPPPKQAPSKNEALTLIGEFLGLDVKENAGPQADLTKDRSVAVEWLIATVPDPIDSRFDYLFDRHLDAMQRALEAAGFVLDRFSLPWLEGLPSGTKVTGATARITHEPGVLLFRWREGTEWLAPEKEPDGKRGLLVLFLIGETPTSGVDKEALRKTLLEIEDLSSSPRPAPPMNALQNVRRSIHVVDLNRVRVLGPTFSGSTVSLDIAIHNWEASQNHPFVFEFISGSATSIARDTSGNYTIAGAPFQATVFPDEFALGAFLDDLEQRQGVTRDKVALLMEANTAYGQAAFPVGGGEANKFPLRIPFPLHIDSLLQATPHPLETASEDQIPALGLRQQRTTVALAGHGRTRDVVPTFSALQAATVETLMESLFSMISREDIRYVGILASDVRDLLFLGEEVRRRCPSAALFTLNGDILYLHESVNQKLGGMQILTTYPLFGPNRIWTSPSAPTSRLQLPMDTAVGVYNATLALLGKLDAMLEYAPPIVEDKEQVGRPSLWVMSVGREGFWPVRTLPLGAEKSAALSYTVRQPPSVTAPGKDIEQGLSSETVSIALSFWCLACLSILYFFVRRSPAALSAKGGELMRRLAALIAAPVSNELEFRQTLYLLASLACLFLFHVLVGVVWFLPSLAAAKLTGWAIEIKAFQFAVSLSIVLVLILLGGGVIALARRLVEARRLFPREGRVSLLHVLIGCGVSSIVALYQIGSWLLLEPDEAMIFYSRAIAFRSGLSPLLPLLFVTLAGFCCTLCIARRLFLVDGRGAEGGVLRFPNPSLSGIIDLEKKIRSFLHCESSQLPHHAFVCVIILMTPPLLAMFVGRVARPFDRGPFLWLFGLGFFAVYFGLAMEFIRFVCTWIGLRKLLRRLMWHPMGRMFSTLRGAEGELALPPINLTGTTHPLSLTQHSLERARRLLKTLAGTPAPDAAPDPLLSALRERSGPMEAAFGRAEERLSAAFFAYAGGEALRTQQLSIKTDEELARIAALTAEALELQWSTTPLGVAGGTSSDAKADAKPTKAPSASSSQLGTTAEQFLASHSVTAVSQVLTHLQNLVSFVTMGLLLMLLAATSYPLQPRNWILLFNWSVVLGAVVVSMVVFVQMSQNQLLSGLLGTTPGKTSWDRAMILRVAIYGVLPILGLLGAQFPETFGQMASWLRRILAGH